MISSRKEMYALLLGRRGKCSECPLHLLCLNSFQLKMTQMPRWQSLDGVLPSPPTATPICLVLSMISLQKKSRVE